MYQNTGYSILKNGQVSREVKEAREKGILFEAADARAHFSFEVSEAAMKELIHRAREGYDYILMDSPAGLGEGFRLACCAADRAVVVSTTDASALRDAQRTVSVLRNRIPRIHLVVNRVQPRLLRRLHTTIDDAMDAAGLPLLGIVPEDPQVMLCANQGQPLILRASRGAAVAYLNIAKRLLGQKAPLMKMR